MYSCKVGGSFGKRRIALRWHPAGGEIGILQTTRILKAQHDVILCHEQAALPVLRFAARRGCIGDVVSRFEVPTNMRSWQYCDAVLLQYSTWPVSRFAERLRGIGGTMCQLETCLVTRAS